MLPSTKESINFILPSSLGDSLTSENQPASVTETNQDDDDNNVKVMVRVRPFQPHEAASERSDLRPCIRVRNSASTSGSSSTSQLLDTCAVVEFPKNTLSEREVAAFQFNECFWSINPTGLPKQFQVLFSDQRRVYERAGLPALKHGLRGFNVCIFAYGQTGSGKTYTMLGTPAEPGLAPRLCDDLFDHINNKDGDDEARFTKTEVECTFYEIYNEKVRDLFHSNNSNINDLAPKIRQHPTKGVFVQNLKTKTVTDAVMTKNLLGKGMSARAAAETRMNARSSRSHAVFQLRVTQNNALRGTQRMSLINLVDLAGSERNDRSGATGATFKEAMNINQSLSTLRHVIDVLIANGASKKKKIPPFRDSILTYVLSDSLGGNSKTLMLATVSPNSLDREETMGTLRYAHRAKAIVCNAHVNELTSAAVMAAMKAQLLEMQEDLLSRTMMRGKGGSASATANEEEIAELEEHIKEREEEITNLQVQQNEMRVLLEEAKEKERVLEANLQHVEARRDEVAIEVRAQRYQRFASAFRNAFLLTKQKKSNDATLTELDTLKRRYADLKNEHRTLQELCDKTMREKEALHAEKQTRERQLVLNATNQTNTEQFKALEDVNHRLMGELHAKDKQIVELTSAQSEYLTQFLRTELEPKVERIRDLEKDLFAAHQETFRLKGELGDIKDKHRSQMRESAGRDIDIAMERQRKDEKVTHLESETVKLREQLHLLQLEHAGIKAERDVLLERKSDHNGNDTKHYLTAIQAQTDILGTLLDVQKKKSTSPEHANGGSQNVVELQHELIEKEKELSRYKVINAELQNNASRYMAENYVLNQRLAEAKRKQSTSPCTTPSLPPVPSTTYYSEEQLSSQGTRSGPMVTRGRPVTARRLSPSSSSSPRPSSPSSIALLRERSRQRMGVDYQSPTALSTIRKAHQEELLAAANPSSYHFAPRHSRSPIRSDVMRHASLTRVQSERRDSPRKA